MIEKVVQQSDVVAYEDNDFFIKNIATESYLDARERPEFRTEIVKFALAAGQRPGQPIDTARLLAILISLLERDM